MSAKVNKESAREQMKAVALHLFWERGFREVSVRDITGAMGLSSAALYAHFASKDALLFELVVEAHDEIGRLISAAEAAGRHGHASELLSYLYVIGVFNSQRSDLARVGREVVHLPAESRSAILSRRRDVRSVVSDVLSRGKDEGPFDVPNLAIVSTLLIRMAQSPAEAYRPDGGLTAREVSRLNARLGLRVVGVNLPEDHSESLFAELDLILDASEVLKAGEVGPMA